MNSPAQLFPVSYAGYWILISFSFNYSQVFLVQQMVFGIVSKPTDKTISQIALERLTQVVFITCTWKDLLYSITNYVSNILHLFDP